VKCNRYSVCCWAFDWVAKAWFVSTTVGFLFYNNNKKKIKKNLFNTTHLTFSIVQTNAFWCAWQTTSWRTHVNRSVWRSALSNMVIFL